MKMKQTLEKIKVWLTEFLTPPHGASLLRVLMPIGVMAVVAILALGAGAWGWEYTNSPAFCGGTCHTMPPQGVTYEASPHTNIYCSECHIGRANVWTQVYRKSEGLIEIYSQTFKAYEFPIRAVRHKPDRITCEVCHQPEAFQSDSLVKISRFTNNVENTRTDTFLILKTGGGSKREGLGQGIHWHVENPVYFYSNDISKQIIPYIKVVNLDGSATEYIDIESGFDPASISDDDLVAMECTTCHNRVTHEFKNPSDSLDQAMQKGLISAEIPSIHIRALSVLSRHYETSEEAHAAIDSLTEQYKQEGYYAANQALVDAAIAEIKHIYDVTFFPVQEVDWTTHPNNLGHLNSPGCFRCHDGKHLTEEAEAIRLECNLCHSIPIVADEQDFVADLEINVGPEPESHQNSNWISLHNQALDLTCSNCHTTGDPGGVSNTSFCSNSACHSNVFTYAGFNAPALREAIQDQLPPPAPLPSIGKEGNNPTFNGTIILLFEGRCLECHADAPSAELDLRTYASAMRGSKNGAVIMPNNSPASRIVEVQSGDHFSNFTADELLILKLWIDNGAIE